MDEKAKGGSYPLEGEERHIRVMLGHAINLTRRICHPADKEDVRGFLAMDVTVTVRRYLLSESNTASMKTLVLRATVNRISKVRARRLTRERHLQSVKAEPTHIDDHTDALTVIARLPKRLQKLAIFLEGLGRPVQSSDTFDIVFACGLEVCEVAPAIAELGELLNGLNP
jgi:hypothetical protein